MLRIYIDADACPVKDETYKVAERYGLPVHVVTNTWMTLPERDWLHLEVVDSGFDAADDWIVEQCGDGDVVVTGDILLAERCLQQGASVLGHKGTPFTNDSIGDAVATRELMATLREMGQMTGGPAPFQKKDRSRFLQGLDTMIQKIRQSQG
jgi:uncharacterized protein YaiI (UPF0178 family)